MGVDGAPHCAPPACGGRVRCVAGALEEFIYANFKAAGIYAANTPTSVGRIIRKFIWQVTSNELAWLGVLVAPLYLLLVRDVAPSERRSFAFAALCFFFSLIAVLATRRLDEHHFLQLLAPLSMITGLSVAGVLRLDREPMEMRKALAVLLIVLGPLLSLTYFNIAQAGATAFRHFIGRQPWPHDASIDVGDYLRDHMELGDSLFVMDYNPVVYTMVDAPIPSPYVLPHFLLNPWYEAVMGIDQAEVLDSNHRAKADLRGGSGAAQP